MSQTKLPHYLWPKGRSNSEPNLMPNVNDSDGNTVLFNGDKRKTTEATVVNLGDSPNSNNGDPLRTAFAKINNFIEATYWWDEGINQKFRDLDSALNAGVTFSTDSDEIYSISITDDSKLGFKGTANQIEVSTSRKKSVNNPNDWDSEVNIKFQLAHTLEAFNINVNEYFTIKDSDGVDRVTYRSVDYPTTHNERAQNGIDVEFNIGANVVLGRDSDDVVIVNGRIASNLLPYGDEIYNLGDSDNKWKDLYLSGNTIYLGSVQIKNDGNRGLAFLDSDGKTLDVSFNTGIVSRLQVDSDIVVLGTVTANSFKSNSDVGLSFDNDVAIKGDLIVQGTTTTINSQNLEVKDNVIVLNQGQTTPFNNIGLVFSRYDSDNVSASNWNTTLVWDETSDKFTFAQTSSSGILPSSTLTNQYLNIGQTVEFFDSDNQVRMTWDKDNARLSIYNKNGTEVFAVDADSGQIEGNGTIDAGTF